MNRKKKRQIKVIKIFFLGLGIQYFNFCENSFCETIHAKNSQHRQDKHICQGKQRQNNLLSVTQQNKAESLRLNSWHTQNVLFIDHRLRWIVLVGTAYIYVQLQKITTGLKKMPCLVAVLKQANLIMLILSQSPKIYKYHL